MVSIACWLCVYSSLIVLEIKGISPSQWHAHEMLYGYGMAVVSGFLLTAVKNWTNVQTVHSKPLLGLFALWCAARVLFLFGTDLLAWAALTDLLFGLMLIMAITSPIVQARQWQQLAVVTKVLLLWLGNLMFYAGAFGWLDDGMLYAINGAVLIFVSLILMIGRRVIPFFIERGVAHLGSTKIQLQQYKWLDMSILFAFLALFLNEMFIHALWVSAILALLLFVLNGYRLCNWHTLALWQVPLVWSLYVASWLINLGFLLYGLQAQLGTPAILTLHLFTIGGIGLMTLSMMSRVALGHSGRDIKALSPWMKLAFLLIVLSALFRIVLPLLMIQSYSTWIVISGICWIAGFALFLLVYAPILCKPRLDGTYG